MNKRNRFTLIELLVVIAIIAILASMLLPVLGSARKKSKTAVCNNSQKNLTMATFNYTTDNDNYYPYVGFVSAPTGHVVWDDLISTYLGRDLSQAEMDLKFFPKDSYPDYEDVFKCPSDDLVPDENNYRRTYTMVRGPGQVKIGSVWYRSAYAWKEGSQKVTDIDDPSGSAIFSEYPRNDNYIGHASNYAHTRSPNYQSGVYTDLHGAYTSTFAFGDGHVEVKNVFSGIGTGTRDQPRGIWTTLSGD